MFAELRTDLHDDVVKPGGVILPLVNLSRMSFSRRAGAPLASPSSSYFRRERNLERIRKRHEQHLTHLPDWDHGILFAEILRHALEGMRRQPKCATLGREIERPGFRHETLEGRDLELLQQLVRRVTARLRARRERTALVAVGGGPCRRAWRRSEAEFFRAAWLISRGQPALAREAARATPAQPLVVDRHFFKIVGYSSLCRPKPNDRTVQMLLPKRAHRRAQIEAVATK